MTSLSILGSGVIFRNPLPGHRVINAIYPYIQPLPSGDWVGVIRVGQALYSPDGMLEIMRSADQGRTWQREGPVRDRARDAKPYNYAEGLLTLLRDGSLVLRLVRIDVTNPDLLVFNEKTQGVLPFELSFSRSTDNGHTWSEPVIAQTITQFPGQEPIPFGRLLELADGTWAHCFETWKQYHDPRPFELNSHLLFSRDGGRTWGDPVRITDGRPQQRSYSHGQPIQLRDGRLFNVYWTAESQLQTSFDLHTIVSTDGTGRHWSAPRATGIPGQSNCATELSDGRLLIAYTHREHTDQPGIRVVLSTDGGATWRVDESVLIWDAYGKESLGVARTATYPSSHDTVAYGAPKIIALDAHQAVASFWCTQGVDIHCRWCRIGIA